MSASASATLFLFSKFANWVFKGDRDRQVIRAAVSSYGLPFIRDHEGISMFLVCIDEVVADAIASLVIAGAAGDGVDCHGMLAWC